MKAEPPALPKEVVVARAVPSHFPLLERVKGKSSEQLTALEESFQRSSQPTDEDLGEGVVGGSGNTVYARPGHYG